MEKQTLLIIAPGNDTPHGDCVYNLLVAETGEHLASHLCSSSGYAKSDLYSGRSERINAFKERFGEVEVKYINETDISNEVLLERNKAWYESTKTLTNQP